MKKFIAIMVLGLLGVASSNAATIEVIYSFGPNTPEYLMDGTEKIVSTGTLPTGSPTSSSDARRIQSLQPEHVMLKDNNLGFVWCWVILTAGAGEMVSLADTTVFLKSHEDGSSTNRLGKSFSYAGKFYSPTSPGVRLNGTRVTTGSATEKVDGKIVFAVGYKSLPVTTLNDETIVRNWFYGTNVRLSTTVTGADAFSDVRLSSEPVLSYQISTTNTFQVFVKNSGDSRSFNVLVAPTVTGPWASTGGTLQAGGPGLDFGPVSDNPQRFFRLVTP